MFIQGRDAHEFTGARGRGGIVEHDKVTLGDYVLNTASDIGKSLPRML
jgi:hypothetical protein